MPERAKIVATINPKILANEIFNDGIKTKTISSININERTEIKDERISFVTVTAANITSDLYLVDYSQ